MGALRFRASADHPFLDDNVENAAPPLARLRELEAASLDLERDGIEEDPRYARLLALLAPGSSLGGARPKAGVLDPQGRLWIAKFPSRSDDHDVGAWEAVTHALAVRAGIRVSTARTMQLGGPHRTFLSQRFDRTATGERIHFGSAMTMLDRVDGDDADAGASYLELAEFLAQRGANVSEDLEQLWCRIVFFMCVSNVDDHLRNHGFLLEPADGWRLAPAYDMNPVADANGLKLNVSDSDNAQDLELAREVSSVFRVKPARASALINKVVAAVRPWRAAADAVGLSRAAQEPMARAFRLVDAGAGPGSRARRISGSRAPDRRRGTPG
jgi:serine/threonine-protein kinase HipA